MEDAQHFCKYQALSYIAHVTTMCRNSSLRCFTGDKIVDQFLVEQQLSMLWFYENIRKNIF